MFIFFYLFKGPWLNLPFGIDVQMCMSRYCVYTCVYMCICLFIHSYLYLSIPVWLFIYAYACISVCMFIQLWSQAEVSQDPWTLGWFDTGDLVGGSTYL